MRAAGPEACAFVPRAAQTAPLAAALPCLTAQLLSASHPAGPPHRLPEDLGPRQLGHLLLRWLQVCHATRGECEALRPALQWARCRAATPLLVSPTYPPARGVRLNPAVGQRVG
jgi:hypothetical protein